MLTLGNSFLSENVEIALVYVVFSLILVLTTVFGLSDLYQTLAVSYGLYSLEYEQLAQLRDLKGNGERNKTIDLCTRNNILKSRHKLEQSDTEFAYMVLIQSLLCVNYHVVCNYIATFYLFFFISQGISNRRTLL